MPELPEVETVRRELEPWLRGRTIRRARRVEAPAGPKYAGLERAEGQRIEGVHRRGKFLLLPLSSGDELVIHLGMTGVISPRPPDRHLRVQLTLTGRSRRELYFRDARRFGRFLVVPRGDYRSLPTLHHMGPEPLGDEHTPRQLARALGRSRMPVKAWLMTQRPVAGLGNIYCDEALWRARVHPSTPASRVGSRRVAALHAAIVEVIAAAIEAQGTTINDYRTVEGGLGSYVAELAAYGHQGDPCGRCRRAIERIVVGGRSSHFCPRCQRRGA